MIPRKAEQSNRSISQGQDLCQGDTATNALINFLSAAKTNSGGRESDRDVPTAPRTTPSPMAQITKASKVKYFNLNT